MRYWCDAAHRVSVDVDGGAVGAGGQHLGGPEELGADSPETLAQVGGRICCQCAELPLDVLGNQAGERNCWDICPCISLCVPSTDALVCFGI